MPGNSRFPPFRARMERSAPCPFPPVESDMRDSTNRRSVATGSQPETAIKRTFIKRPVPCPSDNCIRNALQVQVRLARRHRVGHIGGRRRYGRVAEGGGLLNRYRVVKPYRGFESLCLRHPSASVAGHPSRRRRVISRSGSAAQGDGDGPCGTSIFFSWITTIFTSAQPTICDGDTLRIKPGTSFRRKQICPRC